MPEIEGYEYDLPDEEITERDRSARQILARAMATPKWADQAQILRKYDVALTLRRRGVKVEVDHGIPITNVSVCGLHVHKNLHVISARQNQRKNNAFVSDWDKMPTGAHTEGGVATTIVGEPAKKTCQHGFRLISGRTWQRGKNCAQCAHNARQFRAPQDDARIDSLADERAALLKDEIETLNLKHRRSS